MIHANKNIHIQFSEHNTMIYEKDRNLHHVRSKPKARTAK